MNIDIDLIDWNEFEQRLRVELGREALATTSEMTRIIAEVVSSDEVRGVLTEHDGSHFQRWRALFKRYPARVATKVEDFLANGGFPLVQRLNWESYMAWPESVRRSVERAARKALPFSAG